MSKNQYYVPPQGFAGNPLKKHPNIPCPCDSGLKVKKCCGRFDLLPVELVEKLKRALKYEGFK